MKLPEMTKVEAKGQIEAISRQLSALKTQCEAKDIDVRPWVSHDHPLSVQHWGFVQRRIALKELLKKPVMSAERRKAASLRMTALQKDRQKVASGAVSQCQTPE